MRRSLLCLAIALLMPVALSAQNSCWASDDFDFVEYLIDNGLKKDAKALLSRNTYAPSDTLTYLRAWTAYNLKELEVSRELFRAVPSGSPFGDKSLFYSVAVSAHLGEYSEPVGWLDAYDGGYQDVKNLQLAGLALLRDDPSAFLEASGRFGDGSFALQQPQKDLYSIYSQRYGEKAKSPWLAAAASAVVPGLGKVYAGNLGEGIATFLITGVLGAITAEHWVKDGPGDWKTIVPGALCAVFYIGNIYGSYVSVSIQQNKIKDAQTTAILYNIHIPLRSVFR